MNPAAVGVDDGQPLPSSSATYAQDPLEMDWPSVDDPDAFAARHMTDLGPEIDSFTCFTWRIKDYQSSDKKITSPEFECGGHKWNILLFPTGNSNGQANDMVSIYLNYGDPKHAKEGWHVCAQFALAISNPFDPTCYAQSQAHHRFNNEEQDWGFTRFIDLKKLFVPSDHRSKPVIENNMTDVTAFVRVFKDPTGVLWHNFQNYDSKKETGYVGLKNQGATCYMNSLLQSLFLTNFYRRAVYTIPTEGDSLDSVALALQRVFYLLQTSEQSVSTQELTKSFGWKGFDSFLQHDVQEFNRVLQDKLEGKMKGTSAENSINDLFSGKANSYIRCIDVDFVSDRTETFLDIQLNVKGLKNLEAGFRDYIAEETLDGENKYQAEGHGLQDAKKGIIFEHFPPVLHLQLKRFEYDMMRDVNVKINDRYEYPMQIDLTPYMRPEVTEGSEPWVYNLHGVLVHSGDVHGGHYFVLIKPSATGRWLKFDDDRVTHVTDREVLEENFGGEMMMPDGQYAKVMTPAAAVAKGANKRFTNAYMLVYIRQTKVDEMLRPITDLDTPAHLRTRLDKEKKEAELRKRERDEQHLYLTAKVITDDGFRLHQGFDLATFDENRSLPQTELFTARVLKTQTFIDFKRELLQNLNVPEGETKLWVLVNRQNKTVRPDAAVPEDDPTLTMEVVRDRMASRQHDLKLYLEYQKPGEMQRWAATYPNESPIMVFVKHFSLEEQTLLGLGHFYVHRHLKVSDLVNMINEHMHYPPGTALKIYEEIKPQMIELMKQKATFLQSEIQDGDIVCFQTEMSEQSGDVDRTSKCSTPPQMYDFFTNRLQVYFKPRFEEHGELKLTDFDLTLSKKMNYETMAQKVAEHLEWDPLKLRFWSPGPNGQIKGPAIRRTSPSALSEMVQPNYQTSPTSVIFYELLDISLQELETKKTVKITWMGIHNKEESNHSFLMNKTSSFLDVADTLMKTIKLAPTGGTGRVRVFDIINGKKMKIYSTGETIRDIQATDLYAEEIPVDEQNWDEAVDKIINCFHFQKDVPRTHGVPFRFVLRPNETFDQTKERLQQRMGMGEKEFSRCKFNLVQPSTYSKASPIKDEDVLREHKWLDDDCLAIDHPPRRAANLERAVFIK